VRPDDDQRRPVGHLLGRLHRLLETIEPELLAEVLDVPSVGAVAHGDILG
jgi:hypothetical protein